MIHSIKVMLVSFLCLLGTAMAQAPIPVDGLLMQDLQEERLSGILSGDWVRTYQQIPTLSQEWQALSDTVKYQRIYRNLSSGLPYVSNNNELTFEDWAPRPDADSLTTCWIYMAPLSKPYTMVCSAKYDHGIKVDFLEPLDEKDYLLYKASRCIEYLDCR